MLSFLRPPGRELSHTVGRSLASLAGRSNYCNHHLPFPEFANLTTTMTAKTKSIRSVSQTISASRCSNQGKMCSLQRTFLHTPCFELFCLMRVDCSIATSIFQRCCSSPRPVRSTPHSSISVRSFSRPGTPTTRSCTWRSGSFLP